MPYFDDCYEKQDQSESLGLPNDTSLPFLAYGFFKPHQLAYSRIKGYIYNRPKNVKINNILNHVNGMPVLEYETRDNLEVDAYIMEFKYRKQKKAYNIIGGSKKIFIYKWDVITIEDKEVNVLMNSSDKSFPIYTYKWDTYDWRDDPIFKYTLLYLDENITKLKNSLDTQSVEKNFISFIDVQSLYMTLWTALDRFLTFRYGYYQNRNVKELSKEYFFKEALEKHYDALYQMNFFENEYQNKDWQKNVFSAKYLTEYELNPDKPGCSAMYYYTLRNNVVHAGKMLPQEVNIILNALLGLTEIFRDILYEFDKK